MTTLAPLEAADAPVLARMFQLYLHDMSQFGGWPLGRDGVFAYPPDLLSRYRDAPDHHPYLIDQDGEIAGFCLIRRAPDDVALWDMGQFFVLRKFRGRGVGAAAFARALRRHPGDWQVRVPGENTPARRFWAGCIAGVAGDVCEAVKPYEGKEMTFFTFASAP